MFTGGVYLVGTVMITSGLIVALFEILEIIRWKQATPINAKIIEVSDETWNDGRIRFRYQFQLGGQSYIAWGPWYETFNPLLCLFPQSQIGRIVAIKFDNRKMKIVQFPTVSVLFGAIGIGVSLCGFIILKSL